MSGADELTDAAQSDTAAETFDGVATDALRNALGVPAVHLYATVGSTLDVAHRLARDGAVAGTFIAAEQQTKGRGRGGKRWTSPPGSGLWITLLERPAEATSVRVLTLRLGLALARALEPFADAAVGLKWPNDLYLRTGKLAGVLVEARWRGSSPEWLAVGVGINVISPVGVERSAGLRTGTKRVEVLAAVVPRLRAAAMNTAAALDEEELAEFARRDVAAGRPCEQPARGIVRGINRTGEIIIATSRGDVASNSGSLVLVEDS
jgi:BirA family biotin operon repressor/biotin-[acetyl-CoA-carboxylase] ligase